MTRRSIQRELDEISGLNAGTELPTQQRLEAICALTTRSLLPVRPLPSNSVLILLILAAFVAFSVLVSMPVGFLGFRRLSLDEKLADYAAILLAAILLAATLVKEIIPGSRHRIAPWVSMTFALFAVAFITVVLFPGPDFFHFAKRGLPCLELGTVCAALSGFLAFLFIRKGFSTSPVRTALVTGLLAGLAGFAVLALHCPILNVAHILVWHLGAMLLGAIGGTLIGLARPGTQ